MKKNKTSYVITKKNNGEKWKEEEWVIFIIERFNT